MQEDLAIVHHRDRLSIWPDLTGFVQDLPVKVPAKLENLLQMAHCHQNLSGLDAKMSIDDNLAGPVVPRYHRDRVVPPDAGKPNPRITT